ncbi:MAG: hypothetical protein ABIJ42_07485 [Acidobacteriota bacterium]
MRNRFRLITVSALAVFTITLFFFVVTKEKEPEYFSYIPHDAAGVVVVRSLPDSVDSLQATRLGEWIDFQGDRGSDSPEKEQLRKAVELFRENSWHMMICLHSIRKKESGSLKPELTLFLSVRRGRSNFLAEELVRFAISRFGEGTAQTEKIENTTIIRGPEQGQVFYLEQCGGYIAVSNSKEAWTQLQAIKNMAEGKRLMPLWYSKMIEGRSADIYFYFRGISGWVPRFVYSITSSEEGLKDNYQEF